MSATGNFRVKVVVVGLNGVGKTSQIVRATAASLEGVADPTIVDLYTRDLLLEDGTTITLEFIESTLDDWYRKADAILFVFSITDESSLFELASFQTQIQAARGNSDYYGFVLGNKLDLADQRAVKFDAGHRFAELWKFGYCESSALTGIDVDVWVQRFASQLQERRQRSSKSSKQSSSSSQCVTS